MIAIMGSESHREKSGGARSGINRSAATTTIPKAAIAVGTQAARMMRMTRTHDLQGGGSSAQYPPRLYRHTARDRQVPSSTSWDTHSAACWTQDEDYPIQSRMGRISKPVSFLGR
jgi:hypothetical protein